MHPTRSLGTGMHSSRPGAHQLPAAELSPMRVVIHPLSRTLTPYLLLRTVLSLSRTGPSPRTDSCFPKSTHTYAGSVVNGPVGQHEPIAQGRDCAPGDDGPHPRRQRGAQGPQVSPRRRPRLRRLVLGAGLGGGQLRARLPRGSGRHQASSEVVRPTVPWRVAASIAHPEIMTSQRSPLVPPGPRVRNRAPPPELTQLRGLEDRLSDRPDRNHWARLGSGCR